MTEQRWVACAEKGLAGTDVDDLASALLGTRAPEELLDAIALADEFRRLRRNCLAHTHLVRVYLGIRHLAKRSHIPKRSGSEDWRSS